MPPSRRISRKKGSRMHKASTAWGTALIAGALVVLVVLGVLWGTGVWGPGSAACMAGPRGVAGWDGSGSAMPERHFIERMIPHHEDAIAMAELALARAEHPELKQLAQNIVATQTAEIEQMRAWYREWYGAEFPVAGRPGLRGGPGGLGGPGGMMGASMMGREGRGGMMGGGMMGGGDLQSLSAAADFDREFIEQMVPHHRMGVMMAQMVLARTDRPELRRLAEDIIAAQSAEIEQMREWYQAWY